MLRRVAVLPVRRGNLSVKRLVKVDNIEDTDNNIKDTDNNINDTDDDPLISTSHRNSASSVPHLFNKLGSGRAPHPRNPLYLHSSPVFPLYFDTYSYVTTGDLRRSIIAVSPIPYLAE